MNIFPENSRVVFIGDSITAANLSLSHIVNAYRTQHRDLGVRFYNCGVAGGTAEYAVTSYEFDIARHRPTHAIISFGINDSRREHLAEPRSKERDAILLAAFEVYKEKLRTLVELLLSDGVDVTLCTPTPYDEYTDSSVPAFRGGFALMQGYAEYVRNLARETGVHLLDVHESVTRIIQTDPIISEDHIHPTPHGYFTLAKIFLAAQGIDIGDELPIPEYLARWHSYVARLRKVHAAECMIVRDFDLPTEEKMKIMRQRVENSDWIQPVFESFIRDYVKDKPNEQELYELITESFENDIF